MRKRILSLLLSFAVLAASGLPAGVKAKKEHCAGGPLIVVQGFGSVALLQDRGTAKEKTLWPPKDIPSLIGGALLMLPGLLGGLLNAAFGGSAVRALATMVPGAKLVFEAMRLDDGGQQPEEFNLSTVSFPTHVANSPEGRSASFGAGNAWAEKYGWDHVYVYVYDWRRDVRELAGELEQLVKTAKKESGHSRVSLACLSMGAAVANAYLAERAVKNNFADLANVVYLSPGWQGTSSAGAMLAGELTVNAKALRQLLQTAVQNGLAQSWPYDDLAAQPAVVRVPAERFASLSDLVLVSAFGALSKAGFERLCATVSEAGMQVYLRDMLSHWAGLWALCPQEQYDKARSVCFPAGGKNAAEKKLVASLDQYHKIQGGIKTTIQNMQKAGVGFGVLSLYGRQNTPIHARADLWQADGIIDTRYTGGFPRLASVEPGAAGLPGQEKDAKHDHLSGDGMVDASVCWFPENTWFIHGLEHSSYHDGEDPSLWVAWLADGGCRKGVTGDKNHPQFTKYNEATGKLTGNM